MLIILLIFASIRALYGVPLASPTEVLYEFATTPPAINFRSAAQMQEQTSNLQHFGERGVNDIIISCFATIFACTWSAVHPNIPAPTDCWWTRFKRQVVTMICALLAPELITAWALRQHLAAREFVNNYNAALENSGFNVVSKSDVRIPAYGKPHILVDIQVADSDHRSTGSVVNAIRGLFQDSPLPPALNEGKGVRWTLTHGFFLQMGGFMLCEGGRPIQTLTDLYLSVERRSLQSSSWLSSTKEDTGIIYNVYNKFIDPPRITEEDIKDRSKGDAISKTLIILQTTWFIAQCIARWSSRLPVTELEVVTLAFAMLNIITYALWWHKPQNVGRPVLLEVKKPRLSSSAVPAKFTAADTSQSGGPADTQSPETNMDRKSESESLHPGHSASLWIMRLCMLPFLYMAALLRALAKLALDQAGSHTEEGDLRVGMFGSASDINKTVEAISATVAIGTLFQVGM